MNFLDYLAYIPLFMSMHDNMCFDPLDMSNSKYEDRPPSVQKDMNPLGYAMNKVRYLKLLTPAIISRMRKGKHLYRRRTWIPQINYKLSCRYIDSIFEESKIMYLIKYLITSSFPPIYSI